MHQPVVRSLNTPAPPAVACTSSWRSGEPVYLRRPTVSFIVYCLLLFRRQVVSDSATPWTIDSQAPLFMGFPRQEY